MEISDLVDFIIPLQVVSLLWFMHESLAATSYRELSLSAPFAQLNLSRRRLTEPAIEGLSSIYF